MMPFEFVHLRVHSEYSLVDGLIRVPNLMKELPKRNMNAIAVTEHCNVFSVLKVYQAAISSGIKPIIGSDLICSDSLSPQDGGYELLLLCKNEEGYRNLKRLVSKAYQEGYVCGKPRVLRSWITMYHEGLIALSAGRNGDVGQAIIANDHALAIKRAKEWKTLFSDRFYLEIQRTSRTDEEFYNSQIIEIAKMLDLPLVATNDVRFLDMDDYHAHEARVCIHEGTMLSDPNRVQKYSKQQYLKTPNDMQALFHDMPDALQNTVEIAKRCTVWIRFGEHYLPSFPTPDHSPIEIYLAKLSNQGLLARIEQISKHREIDRALYDARLKRELDVINGMGFAGYFLIVADFIQWAKQNGVAVGPGRGSGAGSLVAYALKITDLDPLHYDLLFERFLNPERVSMPDFDIDFCMEGRDRVIEYVAQRYGRQCVSQIITFGTMAAKAVVRDVGRVLGHPYGFVDKLAKLIPFEIGMTLTAAMNQEKELKRRYQEEDDVKELIDLAMKLEGITRNAGKHAGGVVIAPSLLTDFTGIYCEEGSSQIVSQFDKDDVETIGLVKFDFLGLRTLTIIQKALDSIAQESRLKNEDPVDIQDISLQDDATFKLLKACQTTAVFQLESRGMKDLILRLQPDCFEDIIALVALFRPGPLQSGMVDDFIDRKHGRAKVEYLHPDLEPILKATYGVILYQEQVMQIAQVLANYTLGAADLLRRAMGKKKPEEMAKQRSIFSQGAKERGIDEKISEAIFDLMEKFAGYGFNKSHSAAYALVAYQTAWLKAHYPAYFMASVISSDMDDTDKVVIFVRECEAMGIRILAPSINRSNYGFQVIDEKTIIYGLGAIKGVGQTAILHITEERNKKGRFTGLFHFCQSVDLRKVNKRVLEALIKSGAMDEWGCSRATLYASVESATQTGARIQQHQYSGQTDMFALFDDQLVENYIHAPDWSTQQRLEGEKETLGWYVSGHPATEYQREFCKYAKSIEQIKCGHGKKSILCAMVASVRRITTKSGKQLIILGMEDSSGQLDVIVFSEVYEMLKSNVMLGHTLIIEGECSLDKFTNQTKMLATELHSIADARTKFAACLMFKLTHKQASLLPNLQALIKANQGNCLLQVHYHNDKATAKLTLGLDWRANPSDEFMTKLRTLLESPQVELQYH